MPLSISATLEESMRQWEQMKHISLPHTVSATEAIEFEELKTLLTHLSFQLRNSIWENNYECEERYAINFMCCYDRFMKEYIFRILKNG